jgi:hypothetical protein
VPNDLETITTAWHLNRSVPISLITAILMQTAGMVWWASNMHTRQNALEISDTQQSKDIEKVMDETEAMRVLDATIIAQLDSMKQSLLEVKENQREIQNLIRALSERIQ